MRSFLLLCLLASVRASPPSVKTGVQKGLPGVKRDEKASHIEANNPSLRMFKMRNVMTSWFCNTVDDGLFEERRHMGVCATYDFDQTTSPPREEVLRGYKVMYQTFCNTAVNVRHHNIICTDALLKRTYGQ